MFQVGITCDDVTCETDGNCDTKPWENKNVLILKRLLLKPGLLRAVQIDFAFYVTFVSLTKSRSPLSEVGILQRFKLSHVWPHVTMHMQPNNNNNNNNVWPQCDHALEARSNNKRRDALFRCHHFYSTLVTSMYNIQQHLEKVWERTEVGDWLTLYFKKWMQFMKVGSGQLVPSQRSPLLPPRKEWWVLL